EIVGNYLDDNFEFHGFFLSDGRYTTIDDPTADPFATQGAFGINARGQIVGMYNDSNSIIHGYLFSRGQYTTLDDPGAGTAISGQGTAAEGINDGGQIVGWYVDGMFVGRGERRHRDWYTARVVHDSRTRARPRARD